MKVFYGLESLPAFKHPVVTVGSYDGVHYGHRALLNRVVGKAKENDGESIVVTFSPHPRQVLSRGGEIKLLNTLKEKLFLLEDAGINNVIVLPFTSVFASLSSEEFVRGILSEKIGIEYFVIGYNHRFGKEQAGDFSQLESMGHKFGFTTERIAQRNLGDDKVSSTVIRQLISDGQMSKAADFLARGYIVIAEVRKNNNVIIEDDFKLIPTAGTYPVSLNHNGIRSEDILKIDAEGMITLEKGMKGDVKDVYITFI